MGKNNLSKYNIIESSDNKYIIGYYEDIINYYKALVKEYIDTLDLSEFYSISEIIELLDKLWCNYNEGKICEKDLLRISYSEMGAYIYTIMEG